MKTREARRIFRSAANGTFHPQHVLRRAALQLNMPVVVDTRYGDFRYFPKGVKGQFAYAVSYNPYTRTLVNKKGINEADYNYVDDLEMKPGTHEFVASAGTSIEYVAKDVSNMARYLGMVIPFDFNGNTVVGRPTITGEQLYQSWREESDRRREAYLASDEYKQFLAEQEAAEAAAKLELERLMGKLPTVTRGVEFRDEDQNGLIDWMYEFANCYGADYRDVAAKLVAAGWVENAHTVPEGATPEQEAEIKAEIKGNKKSEAEYIIGQCINCMNINMPPHQIVSDFIEVYRGQKASLSDNIQLEEAA